MHPHLTLMVSQQDVADLRRTAHHDRLVQAATTANRSDAAPLAAPAVDAPLPRLRRFRRRLAHTHPAAR